MPPRSAAAPRPAGSVPARLAAAGLLALAMMLPAPAYASTDVEALLDAARTRTETIDAELHRLTPQVTEVSATVRAEVASAVASAQAATDEARTALALAQDPSDDGRAAVALADAQVALDAASAELRWVVDDVLAADDPVRASLVDVQVRIDDLRGETSRAAG